MSSRRRRLRHRPPARVAFIRSLGRAGVPGVRVAPIARTPGATRATARGAGVPAAQRTDEFVAWLSRGARARASTSWRRRRTTSSFWWPRPSRSSAVDRTHGQPEPDGLRTCLFKDRFWPSPWRTWASRRRRPRRRLRWPRRWPAAAEIGYPVVLKPRTHAGIGTPRAVVAHRRRPRRRGSGRPSGGQHTRLATTPTWPCRSCSATTSSARSTWSASSGCLDRTGEVLALGHSRKVSQSPRRLGVGTMFEPSRAALHRRRRRAVRQVLLGSGLFELEVLVDGAPVSSGPSTSTRGGSGR